MKNIDPNLIKNAAKTKDPKKLFESLSDDDKKTVNSILADKDALAKVLKSPQAAALMKMLSGKDKNG